MICIHTKGSGIASSRTTDTGVLFRIEGENKGKERLVGLPGTWKKEEKIFLFLNQHSSVLRPLLLLVIFVSMIPARQADDFHKGREIQHDEFYLIFTSLSIVSSFY